MLLYLFKLLKASYYSKNNPRITNLIELNINSFDEDYTKSIQSKKLLYFPLYRKSNSLFYSPSVTLTISMVRTPYFVLNKLILEVKINYCLTYNEQNKDFRFQIIQYSTSSKKK
ncbi:hypothetical protein NUSPORA_01850 [Nucleospora cyclopteri]